MSFELDAPYCGLSFAMRNCHVLDHGHSSPFLHWHHSPTFSPTFLLQAVINSSSIAIAKTVALGREAGSAHLQVWSATASRAAFKPIEARIQRIKLQPFFLQEFDARGRDGECNSITVGAGTNHGTLTWWDAAMGHDQWTELDALVTELKNWDRQLEYKLSHEYQVNWLQEAGIHSKDWLLAYKSL